ncbi:MAG TPA: hypothetical protein VNI83_02585 [Vicinamibacterales bacterium]|nr:hypothetical protein [Vicinamibacterales bacterium]
MGVELRLVVPIPSPSLNELVGRGSWWRYQTAARTWRRLIGEAYYAARAAGGPAIWPDPPPAHVRIEIERYTSATLLDPDNFAGGVKPVLDGLKACRLIPDDSSAAIELVLRQHRTHGAATVIRLVAAPQGEG